MGEYFKNKYRVNSLRLSHWDYSWEGLYFVTICTRNRICCLSEIKNDMVYLSEIGKIVFDELLNVPKLRQNVSLNDFIIMPNHIHVIFEIKEDNDFGQRRDTANRVSTVAKFGQLQPKSLSTIVNTFKGGITRKCHEKGFHFQWQNNYYEHIIRDEDDYARIKKYIANNPIKWEFDRNNSNNI